MEVAKQTLELVRQYVDGELPSLYGRLSGGDVRAGGSR